MFIGLLFWIIMVVWVVFGAYTNKGSIGPWIGETLVVVILLGLLGWQVFGPVIHR